MYCEPVFILVTWDWLFQFNGFGDNLCSYSIAITTCRHLAAVLLLVSVSLVFSQKPGISVDMLEGGNWYIERSLGTYDRVIL
jgi:hypothetical protein